MWQLIETAPKDGSTVLAIEDTVFVTRWNFAHFVEGEWTSGDDNSPISPTHWMPLPEPPHA